MMTPSTDDILSSLGLTRTPVSSTPDWVTPALVFGAGVVVGATTALLATPKTGKELRGDISRKALDVSETVAGALPDLSAVSPFRNDHAASIEAK